MDLQSIQKGNQKSGRLNSFLYWLAALMLLQSQVKEPLQLETILQSIFTETWMD